MIESGGSGYTLLFNKFGDPDVDYYKIYQGTEPDPTTVLDTSRQTLKTIEPLESNVYHFFRVTAVSKSGEESEYSNQETIFVKDIEAGENQLLNYNFSANDEYWFFGYYGDIDAYGEVADSTYHLVVNSFTEYGGAYVIQLQIELLRNKTYDFEFDAWAPAPTQIYPLIVSENGNTDYSRIGTIQVSTRHEHYAYSFKHNRLSTSSAMAAFLMENETGEVYIDNVVLKQVIDSDVEDSAEQEPLCFRLHRNYPNPFNGETAIRFSVPVPSEVTFTLYDILGKKIRTFGRKTWTPGEHQVIFRDESLSSGVYFYRMEARDANGPVFESVQKMILMK